MILWNLLLLLPLVYGDVKNPHGSCNTSNELYLDTVLKVRTELGYLSLWNINDVIEFGEIDGKGSLYLIVSNHVSEVKQKYVDESVVRLSVDNRDRFPMETGWRAVEIQYQPQRDVTQDAIHHIHFEVINSLRNTSNELVLKFRQFHKQLFHQEESKLKTIQNTSLRTTWIQDGHCPEPLNTPVHVNGELAVMYRMIFDRSTRVSEFKSDSDGYMVFILQGHGKFQWNVTNGNTESLEFSPITKSLDVDGLTFAIAEYKTKKPAKNTIEMNFNEKREFEIETSVVSGFSEFWNSTSFAGTNLTVVPSLFTVWHFDPITNIGVQFDGPDEKNVFRIQKEFKDNDEVVLVLKKNRFMLAYLRSDPISVHFYTEPSHMDEHTIIVPYRDLVSVGRLEGPQSIDVMLLGYYGNNREDYKLKINESPKDSETTTTTTESPETSTITDKMGTVPGEVTVTDPVSIVPLGLASCKTYTLGENETILNETETIVYPDADGAYYVFKYEPGFVLIFTIEGEWNELSVEFENDRHRKITRKLEATRNYWDILFNATEGEYMLSLTNKETGEKKEYTIFIFYDINAPSLPPLKLLDLRTYTFEKGDVLQDTEESIEPDKNGVYNVVKDAPGFAIIFTIQGAWDDLSVKFENEHHWKVERKLGDYEHEWKIIVRGAEGLYTLSLTDAETEEKMEYPIFIRYNGNSHSETTTESPETSTTTNPFLIVPLRLVSCKTYTLGENEKLLNETETIVYPDEDGVYNVFKDEPGFVMIFTIEGEWNELSVEFENERHRKITRKLEATRNYWDILFHASEGPYMLSLTNKETGEKMEYPIFIRYNGKSFLDTHPPES